MTLESINCQNCGAPLSNLSILADIKCDYCGAHKHDENYINERFDALKEKDSNQSLSIIKVRLDSGRYKEAIDLVTDNLKTNAKCVEAWGILANCRINTMSISNFKNNLTSIEECLIHIKNLDKDNYHNFFSEIHEKIIEHSKNLADEYIGVAKKRYLTYAVDNKTIAIQKAKENILLCTNMIYSIHKLDNESQVMNLKSAILMLYAINSIDSIKNLQRFKEFKNESTKVVNDALEKDNNRVIHILKKLNLGYDIKVILKGKNSASKTLRNFFICLAITFIIVIMLGI